jgi:predicted nucleic acid-binding protein
MKILVDSSTIYSAIVYSDKKINILDILIEKYTIVISDYIIEELKRNFNNKLTGSHKEKVMKQLDIFISNCQVKTKNDYIQNIRKARKYISDKDSPILACGMLPDIDYLLTSDKEFWNLKIKDVKIITPKVAKEQLI